MNPLFKRQIPFIALLVGLLVFGAAAPQQMVDVGIWALIYGFAAIGLSLLMGLAGQVSLGHAAFIAVGAYTQALLVAKANLNPLLAAPISVVAAMLVALRGGDLAAARAWLVRLADDPTRLTSPPTDVKPSTPPAQKSPTSFCSTS